MTLYDFKSDSIPPDYLESLKYAMNFGLISKQDITSWAMKMISDNKSYDLNLLNLIDGNGDSARDLSYQINLITKLHKEKVRNAKRIIPAMLCQQLNEKIMDERKAAKILYDFYIYLDHDWQENNSFNQLYHNFEYVDSGISGTIEECRQQVREALAPYCKLRLDNYPEWQGINDIIDKEIQHAINKPNEMKYDLHFESHEEIFSGPTKIKHKPFIYALIYIGFSTIVLYSIYPSDPFALDSSYNSIFYYLLLLFSLPGQLFSFGLRYGGFDSWQYEFLFVGLSQLLNLFIWFRIFKYIVNR